MGGDYTIADRIVATHILEQLEKRFVMYEVNARYV